MSDADARPRAATPGRSREQRLAALAHANEIRLGRAQLKGALREGRLGIVELLADPPELARTAKIAELLLAVPKLGRARVARLLMQCRISEAKTLAGLSERQRAELAGHLGRDQPEREAATRHGCGPSARGGHGSNPQVRCNDTRSPVEPAT